MDAPTELSDLALWSLLVGALLPNLTAVIQQPRWTNRVRVAVGLAVSALAAGGTSYFAADLDGRSFVSSLLLVAVSSMTFYNNVWKKSGVAPRIEAATSKGAAYVVDEAPITAPSVEPAAKSQADLDAAKAAAEKRAARRKRAQNT